MRKLKTLIFGIAGLALRSEATANQESGILINLSQENNIWSAEVVSEQTDQQIQRAIKQAINTYYSQLTELGYIGNNFSLAAYPSKNNFTRDALTLEQLKDIYEGIIVEEGSVFDFNGISNSSIETPIFFARVAPNKDDL